MTDQCSAERRAPTVGARPCAPHVVEPRTAVLRFGAKAQGPHRRAAAGCADDGAGGSVGLEQLLESRAVRCARGAFGARVWIQAGVFAAIFLISIVVTAGHLLVKRWLQLDWRAWLTDVLIGRWMEDGRHYRLLFSAGEHDNPDQRIAEDIRIATDGALGLAHTLFYSLLSLSLFVEILWNVSGSITVPGTSPDVPGYMVPLAFCMPASARARLAARPAADRRPTRCKRRKRTSVSGSRARGSTRKPSHWCTASRSSAPAHISIPSDRSRLRPAVARVHGSRVVLHGLRGAVAGRAAARRRTQYIAGAMSLGALMQAAQAFQRLTRRCLGRWTTRRDRGRARLGRAGAFVCTKTCSGSMRKRRCPRRRASIAKRTIETSAAHEPRARGLCASPSVRTDLLENFSVGDHRGERVLVTGDPRWRAVVQGHRRALALGQGPRLVPGRRGMLFMPQRPYLPEGTLREALCYPRAADAFAER